jgi:hypothetical protein
MSAHTPGPWKCETPGDCIVAVDGTHVVCFGHDYDDYGYLGNVADARLIAAAPDLLEACKAVLEQFDSGALVRNTDSDGLSDWALRAVKPLKALADMKAAIAKAEGTA